MGSNKVTYNSGSLYRFEDDLSVTALVTTANGYAANLQVVTLTWTSGAWSSSSSNYQRTALGLTSTDGKTTISLTDIPTSTASQSCLISGAITFRHYYDVDTVKVSINSYSASMNVYHFAYSVYVSS